MGEPDASLQDSVPYWISGRPSLYRTKMSPCDTCIMKVCNKIIEVYQYIRWSPP